jgi:hypothetical protein
LPLLLIQQRLQQFYLLIARELARLTKNHNNRPTSSSTTDSASDARFKSQDLVTHSFHHLKEKAFILPPARRRKSVVRKMSYQG